MTMLEAFIGLKLLNPTYTTQIVFAITNQFTFILEIVTSLLLDHIHILFFHFCNNFNISILAEAASCREILYIEHQKENMSIQNIEDTEPKQTDCSQSHYTIMYIFIGIGQYMLETVLVVQSIRKFLLMQNFHFLISV